MGPSGAAETAAGAIFGGLIGASFGAKRASNVSAQKEMERLGLTPEMLEMAQDVGSALERGLEGLQATKESLESQQLFARRLDEEASQLYEQAKKALNDNEERAKSLLLKRETALKRLKKTLQDCAEEKRRVEQMERNVQSLEQR